MHSRKLTSGWQWGLSTVGHFWSHCQLCTHALGYAGKSLTAGHWGFVQRVLWLRWSTLPKAVGGQLQVANREVAGEWDFWKAELLKRDIGCSCFESVLIPSGLPLQLTLSAIVWKYSARPKYLLLSPDSTFDKNSDKTDSIQWMRRKDIQHVRMSFCVVYIKLYHALNL